MWIYIPLVCPLAKTRLLKRTETVTIDIILFIGFQKKKLDVQLEKNLLLRFDPSKAKIICLMFRMEISEDDHIIQLFKGGGEQNRSSELSRTSCPSIWGRIYLANKNPMCRRATSFESWDLWKKTRGPADRFESYKNLLIFIIIRPLILLFEAHSETWSRNFLKQR